MNKMSEKACKVAGIVLSIVGALVTVMSDKIREKNTKDEIAKQVAEAVAKKD